MQCFVPVLRENREMMYQFDHDYVFNSSKLARAYEFEATGYREGLAADLEGPHRGAWPAAPGAPDGLALLVSLRF